MNEKKERKRGAQWKKEMEVKWAGKSFYDINLIEY